MNRRVALAVFAAMLFTLSGCRTYGVREDLHLTAPWNDYQRVVVRTCNGSVALSTGDVPEIRISGTKHARAPTVAEAEKKLERLTVIAGPDSRDASVFVVELECAGLLRNQSVGASFEIQVPAPCAADVRTGNGSIVVNHLKDEALLETSNGQVTVDNVSGKVDALSRNGRITAKNVTGDLTAITTNAQVKLDDVTGVVNARSSNGGIAVENVTGDLTAATSSGAIDVKSVRGNCKLKTSNGTIQVQDAQGSVEATTSNGNIRVDAAPPKDGSVLLQTTNGSIYAALPPDLKADLELRTGNGVVQTMLADVPLRVQLWSQNRVKAKMNGGGEGRISARTSNGSITLNCR